MSKPMRVTSIRLPGDTIKDLTDLSHAQGGDRKGRSRNVLIREAIDDYLEKEVRRGKRAAK